MKKACTEEDFIRYTDIGIHLNTKEVGTMVMDLAAMSMNMSTAKVQQNVGIALLKNSMEQQETVAQNMVQMLSPSGLGANIDTYA